MHGKSNYGGNDQINAKKRHFQFILAQRWVSVIDSVPTLIQNKANMSCVTCLPSKHDISTRCPTKVWVQLRVDMSCSLSREYDYIFWEKLQIDCPHVRSAATHNNSIYRSSRGPVPGQSLRQRTNTKTGPGQYRMPTGRYTSINKVWGWCLKQCKHQHNPRPTYQKQKKTYNTRTTSDQRRRRWADAAHVTRMSCVRWERPTAHPGRHEFANKHIYPASTTPDQRQTSIEPTSSVRWVTSQK